MYVIQRTDGKYVNRPGSRTGYTSKLEQARKFPTREAAEADRCPGNETVVDVAELLQQ